MSNAHNTFYKILYGVRSKEIDKQLKSPQHLRFEGNLAENGKNGCKDFDLYLIASVIDKKAGKVKLAFFLHVAGVEARNIYNTFNIFIKSSRFRSTY